ncbi:MAG: hypothetical protein ACT4NU_13530 [Chromatiales bacterium]
MTLREHLPYASDRAALAELVYTPLEQAVDLFRVRQSEDLFHQLERDGLLEIPDLLKRNGVAVMCRQIGTPNHEMQRFLELTAAHDLLPIIWEYHADKFMPRNPMKYAWGRLGFFSGLGRNGGVKLDYINVIDFNKANGLALRDVRTLWGQSLVELHHDLLLEEYPGFAEAGLYDGSRWFAEHGGAARNYYRAFLALFLRHAILFETFLLHGDELQFLREIFLPAFYDVYSTFGVKPLITPIEPEDSEGDRYWQLYPGHIRQYLGAPAARRLLA